MPTISKSIELDKLLYDPQNPRLPLKMRNLGEDETIDYMLRNGNITELMQSIAELGYSNAEPLLVVKAKSGEYYNVVEGNRRLTALKLLKDPSQAKIRRQLVEQISEEAKNKPTVIPCIIYEKRDDILSYLGFRHITGIKEWGSLEKARYLQQLYELNKNGEGVEIYKTLAKMIGSRSDYVKKLLIALELFNRANNNAYFGSDIGEDDINFSYFTTAIGYSSIVSYLNIQFDDSLDHLSKMNEENYRQLFLWMFDKKVGVVKEIRQLSTLARVVESERAIEKLKSGSTLEIARLYTSEPEEMFFLYISRAIESLNEAKSSIEQLSAEPKNYDERLSEIEKLVKSIRGGIDENFGGNDNGFSLTKEEYEKIKGMLEQYRK